MEPSERFENDSYYADITAPEAAAAGSSRRLPRRLSNPLPYERSRRPSIRLLRAPLANQSITAQRNQTNNEDRLEREDHVGRRSNSLPGWLPAPETSLSTESSNTYEFPVLGESSTRTGLLSGLPPQRQVVHPVQVHPWGLRAVGASARSMFNRGRSWIAENPSAASPQPDEYRTDAVDILDVVDPEVSTLTTLTNVQNSLFVPDLGRFVNRRPVYHFAAHPTPSEVREVENTPVENEEWAVGEREEERHEGHEEGQTELEATDGQTLERSYTNSTVRSDLSESRFAVLPEGISLEGWTTAEKRELNDHVRHMLRSNRSKFKRGMKGFWKYVKKPLGFLVTLYCVLITLFGLAWVLFLIGWINVGGQQLYAIHVIDNILVALFAIVGDGLAPFRAVDTYRMIFIARYHFLTWRRRREKNLPGLKNKNDLPLTFLNEDHSKNVDLEEQYAADQGLEEYSVLTPKQQRRFIHHATKFAKSHTFYKPHETTTHHAFPIRLLIAIVILLDFHSAFQIALGSVTWGIDYRVRPVALTIVILCCSIACNCTAGILILIGDRRTRKKDVIEKMFRQKLTREAITKVTKRKGNPKSESKKELKRRKKRQARERKRAWKKQHEAMDDERGVERYHTNVKTPDKTSD
ncbi:hypothetical protein VTO42DRAFT_4211 [Malbranchea cinnamomea]